jgi:hypothetical protein
MNGASVKILKMCAAGALGLAVAAGIAAAAVPSGTPMDYGLLAGRNLKVDSITDRIAFADSTGGNSSDFNTGGNGALSNS